MSGELDFAHLAPPIMKYAAWPRFENGNSIYPISASSSLPTSQEEGEEGRVDEGRGGVALSNEDNVTKHTDT